MTVKELKEKLEQFPESDIVLIPNPNWNPYGRIPSDVPVTLVIKGGNEYDGCVFLDCYEEDEDED